MCNSLTRGLWTTTKSNTTLGGLKCICVTVKELIKTDVWYIFTLTIQEGLGTHTRDGFNCNL